MARFSLRRPDPDADDLPLEDVRSADPEVADPGIAEAGRPAGRRSMAGAGRGRAPVEVVDDGLKPSAMRRPEPLYGYVVALELLVVAVLNLTVTKGKGAPAHPNTGLAVAGVAASVALAALIFKVKHRTIVGFGAIVAAFVVNLARGPNSLAVAHIFALVFPFAYAFIITQRQRKLMTGQLKAARAAGRGNAGAGSRGGAAPAGRRSATTRADRRRGSTPPAAKGPQPNARYTPPKPKRQKPAGR